LPDSHLVVWGELHGHDTVDVFLDLGEEIVPALDEAALALVAHQLQLVPSPDLTDLDPVV